ncbi:MAG: hypothetical protein N2C12_13645, partial [Planctomycetales bacterium]
MASGPTSPAHSPAVAEIEAPPTYADFIDETLEKTKGYLKFVDIGTACLTMFVATLVYLLGMVLVDHWLVSGGLGVVGRTAAFLVLASGLFVYAWKKLLPHLWSRINPAYAAMTIERSEPTLKNSVLNFLLLRRSGQHVPTVVIRGLEQQAAEGLSHVSIESAVDRSRLVRLSIILIAVILACAIYQVISPKPILPSVGRTVLPWADIDPVTRVRIENVRPGDAQVLLFSQTEVLADVKGLGDDEPVFLIYSTEDETTFNQRIPMYRGDGNSSHLCILPGDQSGLACDVVYRVEAGDCVSPTYRLSLIAVPSFQVRRVEYRYPAYTKLGSRTVDGVGDIKAIDGTRVVIHAEANQEIASAEIQLMGLVSKSISMAIEGRSAVSPLTLRRRITGDDSIPELTGYKLHMASPTDQRNANPIRHRIHITADLPPLVEI